MKCFLPFFPKKPPVMSTYSQEETEDIECTMNMKGLNMGKLRLILVGRTTGTKSRKASPTIAACSSDLEILKEAQTAVTLAGMSAQSPASACRSVF
jgi:hypothetical protein